MLAILGTNSLLIQKLKCDLAVSTIPQHRDGLRLILETALDAAVVMKSDGVVADWNDRAAEVFGWSRDEAVGRTVADLVIPERYRKAHRDGIQRYLETGQGKVLGRRIELSGLRKNGDEFPVELSISPIQDHESILFVGFLRDLAERNVLRLAGASLEDFVAYERLLADLSARFANIPGERLEAEIEGVLRQLLTFLGFDRCNYTETTVDGWLNVVGSAAVEGIEPYPHGPVPADFNWYIEQARAGKIILARTLDDLPAGAANEVEHFRRSGVRSFLRVPIGVGGRNVGGISLAAFHYTREWPEEIIARLKIIGEVIAQALTRKRSEDALQATRSELTRVARITLMGTITASIAHELNQPLAAISANSSAAQRWLSNEQPNLHEVDVALKSIIKDTHRASHIIDNIRAMFTKNSREKRRLNINDVIEDTLTFVHSEIVKHGITVQTELAPGLPDVFADRAQLQQVLLNLVMNAIDAMRSISNRQRLLTLRSNTENAIAVVITVEDSGTGINTDNRKRVFDAFFSTKSEGMGIGLSVCRSIVESHDGSLLLSPGVSYGSVFRVVLPSVGDDSEPLI